jgi:lysophospholipase L1-like esterase
LAGRDAEEKQRDRVLAMKNLVIALGVVVSACGIAVRAQQAPPAVQATAEDGYQATHSLELYREGNARMFMNDFGQLERYHDADVALGPAAPGERRVVFFGDSITDIWKLDDSFPGKHYINRGIGGQTTPQMLVRFRQDVIDLHPAVVVILAGTNDIAGNTGTETLDQIEADYESFAELAKENGIRVVFSSLTPINAMNQRALWFYLQRSPEKILALNVWLKNYCADHGLVYLDYFSAMVDQQGFLKRNLTEDGLHPNAAGFAVMAPLAEVAIEKSLGEPVGR